jgi:hypothetical protein
LQQQVPLGPTEHDALFQEFAHYLKPPKPHKTAILLEPRQRDALFQDFAEYQKHQHLMIAYYPTADH